MRLDSYGYRETKNSSRARRRALGRAIRGVGYERVYDALQSRKNRRRKRYRIRRLETDIDWLLERAERTGVNIFR